MEIAFCIIGIAVLGLLLLFLVITFLCERSLFGKRCEGNPYFRYLTAEDFDGLEAESVEIPLNPKKKGGDVLRGFIYYRQTECGDKGVIAFSHGMGAGHFAYTQLINDFCLRGYTVVAVDNRGTVLSDGGNLGGFYEGAANLMRVLKFIGEREDLKNRKLFLVGHSWGAVSVCRVLNSHFPVTAAAEFSGFNSERRLFADSAVDKTGKKFAAASSIFFALASLIDYGVKALKPVTSFIKKSGVPLIAFHGSDDTMVRLKNSVAYVSKQEGLKNVTCVFLPGRGHNPYQTRQSEQYMLETFAKVAELEKEYGGKIPKYVRDRFFDKVDENLLVESNQKVIDRVDNFFSEAAASDSDEA